MMRRTLLLCLFAVAACAPTPDTALLAPTPDARATIVQTVTLDALWREGLPVVVVAPGTVDGPLPVVLFSTGAFSSPQKYMALLKPWAEAGYAVLAPLHVDSEAWSGPRPADQADQLSWRIQDIAEIMRNLPVIERETGLALSADALAATGHSFGGLVAQVLAGATAGNVGPLSEIDVDAIVAISPPGPIPGYIEASGWAKMAVPQLLTTGTGDVIPNFVPEWTGHLGGHIAHPGESWAQVGEGADHYFGNVIGRTEYPGPPQNAQFDEMSAATLLFLDAYIKGNDAAMMTLMSAPQGSAARVGLTRK